MLHYLNLCNTTDFGTYINADGWRKSATAHQKLTLTCSNLKYWKSPYQHRPYIWFPSKEIWTDPVSHKDIYGLYLDASETMHKITPSTMYYLQLDTANIITKPDIAYSSYLIGFADYYSIETELTTAHLKDALHLITHSYLTQRLYSLGDPRVNTLEITLQSDTLQFLPLSDWEIRG